MEKHVVEDDILFTKPLAGKGLNRVYLILFGSSCLPQLYPALFHLVEVTGWGI